MALKKINRKAENMVLVESLKLVIAILCLLLLTYLAWNLYNIFTTKSGLAQAKETLNQISDKIEGLKEGKDNFMIVAPKDWYLIKNNKKLCICEKKDILGQTEDTCCVKGAFRIIEKEFTFDSVCFNKINYCLSFDQLPITLYFENKEGKIVVLTEYSLSAENLFNSLLEFKGTGQKTVKDLCQDYINGDKVEGEITNILKEFSKANKEGMLFEIKDEDKNILMSLYLNNGEKVFLGDYWFRERSVGNELVMQSSAGKKYSVVLQIGEYIRIEQGGNQGTTIMS